MAHYFTNDYIESNEKQINVKVSNLDLKFITDNGTFSKKGLDFGTRTLLENIDFENIEGDVLDLGCGWGPIGITIAKNKKSKIDMVDINERAINLAKKNAKLNDVNVNIYQSNAFENIEKKYDYIVTNPPIRVGKEILYNLLFSSLNHLKEKGKLYLVVNKNQGAKTLMKDLSVKAKTTLIVKNKGFYIISAENR
ncbi:MAG: class I SAM-dependent methyltransferase [Bacilli bacterium]|nr:class I SAM-dependent methyltransferase [Bacilli bacterium]